MLILGIETTCDETSAAVLENGRLLRSNVVFSQIALHRGYGGVVPELASRAHAEKIAPVISAALDKAGLDGVSDIDYVAFANGPGLPGALLVGRVAAETASALCGAPLVGVNHLEGHLYACEFGADGKVGKLSFPLVALIASGGHTELWLVRGYGDCRVLGRTRDDAAGEAFDKVAKLLGLGYPGGPAVERAALGADPDSVKFPRPTLPGTWDFSFSGLKTAVSYYLRDHSSVDKNAICASFQAAVVDTLAGKTVAAARYCGVGTIAVGGGVAANGALRAALARAAVENKLRAVMVEKKFCSDNGAMIALAAHKKIAAGRAAAGGVRINPELRTRAWRR